MITLADIKKKYAPKNWLRPDVSICTGCGYKEMKFGIPLKRHLVSVAGANFKRFEVAFGNN